MNVVKRGFRHLIIYSHTARYYTECTTCPCTLENEGKPLHSQVRPCTRPGTFINFQTNYRVHHAKRYGNNTIQTSQSFPQSRQSPLAGHASKSDHQFQTWKTMSWDLHYERSHRISKDALSQCNGHGAKTNRKYVKANSWQSKNWINVYETGVGRERTGRATVAQVIWMCKKLNMFSTERHYFLTMF